MNYWTYKKPKAFEGSKADQLERKAESLERQADSLEGTCWLGDCSPSEAKRREAADAREHAMLLRLHEKRLATKEQE